MTKIRVLLVDDHLTLMDQIETRLTHEDDIEIVGKAEDGKQALKLALKTLPQVMMIDPLISKKFDLNLIKTIQEIAPQIGIVVLTTFVDTSLYMELKKLGIHWIFEKGTNSQQLVDALREASLQREK